MAENNNESKNSDYDISLDGDYEPRFIGYHDLMRFKIREILLVSSWGVQGSGIDVASESHPGIFSKRSF